MVSLTSILLVAVAAVTGTSASPVPQQSDGSWQNAVLNEHNKDRAYHHSPPLSWDNGLASSAQNWANQCNFGIEPGRRNYGQNVYQFYGTPINQGVVNAVNSWYSGGSKYNYSKPGFSSATGGFTQVVWKSTTHLGCAYSSRCGQWTFVVCNYGPPGNYQGQYQQNVLPA